MKDGQEKSNREKAREYFEQRENPPKYISRICVFGKYIGVTCGVCGHRMGFMTPRPNECEKVGERHE